MTTNIASHRRLSPGKMIMQPAPSEPMPHAAHAFRAQSTGRRRAPVLLRELASRLVCPFLAAPGSVVLSPGHLQPTGYTVTSAGGHRVSVSYSAVWK